MRKIFWIGLFAAVHLGVPKLGLAQSGAADPRLGAWVGTWALLSAEASVDPPNRLSITPLKGGIHVVMAGETHFDFVVSANGHESAAPGNLGFDQIALHRTNKRQAEVTEKKDGAVVAMVRQKLSNDGNELTTTTAITGKADQVTVWMRSGGAKAATDLFVGDWTQDMSKTRMRQGQALRIGAEGAGSVRFQWDFSYTARFDGRPYELKNSRNDTVTLGMVDPHTVEAVYRRDNQVVQKDRWVVSADGQQMTDTSAGTLETGQHVTEKLVFKRQ